MSDLHIRDGWGSVHWVRALAIAATAACADPPIPQPPPIPPETLSAEHEEWRAGRRNSLANPEGGVVSWIGLWELAFHAGWHPASEPDED